MGTFESRQHHRVIFLTLVIFALAAVSLWTDTAMAIGHGSMKVLTPGTAFFTKAVAFFVCVVTALILVRNSLREQAATARMAWMDDLTGLPNRRQFEDRLSQELARAARRNTGIAVMYFDLDRFKEINDCYGHEAGDAAIAEFAQRLQNILRNGDIAARLAGDEFAAIISSVDSGDVASRVAARLLNEMKAPFVYGKVKFYATASIGAAIIRDGMQDTPEALRRADFALLQAKRDGRNRLQVFDPDLARKIKQKRVMESDLREAMSQRQFHLEYQPQFAQTDQRVVGVEALVRWKHPDKGNIPPVEFIPLAEETGAIHELGEFVLRQSCMDIEDFGTVKLAVNVSPIQFRHAEFVNTVKDILAETGFDPHRLELEITEGIFITNPSKTAQTIDELRDLGIKVALDDFGTGYSTMSYLNEFALDRIKIDKSFVDKIGKSSEAASIVASMMQLASSLGLGVTVEGVESQCQMQQLQTYENCELQGFLLSRPMPLERLDKHVPGLERGTAQAAGNNLELVA